MRCISKHNGIFSSTICNRIIIKDGWSIDTFYDLHTTGKISICSVVHVPYAMLALVHNKYFKTQLGVYIYIYMYLSVFEIETTIRSFGHNLLIEKGRHQNNDCQFGLDRFISNETNNTFS